MRDTVVTALFHHLKKYQCWEIVIGAQPLSPKYAIGELRIEISWPQMGEFDRVVIHGARGCQSQSYLFQQWALRQAGACLGLVALPL